MRNFFAGFAACAVALCAGYALASRNSAGTMSLFTPGNPVVSGTSISSSWANNTLSDFATELTDSLSRSGKGGMLAALRGINGTVASPALSFTNEPGSGIYRVGANDFGFSINGVLEQEWTASAVTFAQPAATFGGVVKIGDGAFGAPAYSFTTEATSGIYRKATNDFGFSVNGILNQEWKSGLVEFHQPVLTDDVLQVTGASTFNGNTTIGNGVAVDGGGLKHQSVSGCTTSSGTIGNACNNTLTWTTAFADTNYQAYCSCAGASSGSPVMGQVLVGSASALTISTVAANTSAARCTSINCLAVHN